MWLRHLLFIIMAITLLWISNVSAATINAASASRSDVQTAINTAVSGDVVIVPAGFVTWTTAVSIPTGKKITLQGSGMDATVITGGDGWKAIDMTTSGSRVTGIGFISSAGVIQVDGDGWRIDQCRFYSDTFVVGVSVYGNRENNHPTGLIDSCIFHNMRITVDGYVAGSLPTAHALWAQPLNLGSGDGVVYVENNTFTFTVFGNAIDANVGGRYVFRYNTLNDVYIEAHATLYNDTGTRKWEIYNNTFTFGATVWVPFRLRGGTGVVFNNTLIGAWTLPNIVLDDRRSCELTASGLCDGSSPWDGNMEGLSGYPCRGQIGRSTDQWLWTSTKPYPPQQLEPAYAWNNKFGAKDVTFFQFGCARSISHIQPGRDYFDNTVKPGYVPYTYPHPLRSVAETTATTTPTTTTVTTPTTTTTNTTTKKRIWNR